MMDTTNYSAEFEFTVDPASPLWDALIPRPTYEVSFDIPARRRSFWEWLTRKPKHGARTGHVFGVAEQVSPYETSLEVTKLVVLDVPHPPH